MSGQLSLNQHLLPKPIGNRQFDTIGIRMARLEKSHQPYLLLARSANSGVHHFASLGFTPISAIRSSATATNGGESSIA